MINLEQLVDEALLGRNAGRSAFANITKDLLVKFLCDYCGIAISDTGKYITSKTQYKVRDRELAIKKYPESRLLGKMGEINGGDLYITDCPELESLEGFFDENGKFDVGSISITNCPKLKSLGTLPRLVKGDFIISNCPMLNDLTGMPEEVNGTVSISRIGKKLKKNELTHMFRNKPSRVHCEDVENEPVLEGEEIFEAFGDGRLQEIWSQVQQFEKEHGNPLNDRWDNKKLTWHKFLEKMLDSNTSYVAFDKLSSENIKTITNFSKPNLKIINSIISDRVNTPRGIVVGFKGGKMEFCIGTSRKPSRSRWGSSYGGSTVYAAMKKNIKFGTDSIDASNIGSYLEGCDKVICVNLSDIPWESELNTSKLHNERVAARVGMINPGDIEQYKEIAKANMSRYKEIVANKRALEDPDVENLETEVNEILMRANKMLSAVRNPMWVKNHTDVSRYDISSVMDTVFDKSYYVSGSRPGRGYKSGQDGVMYWWNRYIMAINEIIMASPEYGKPATGWAKPNSSNLMKERDNLKANLNKAIDNADAKLAKYGF